jgi:hypothetical protein
MKDLFIFSSVGSDLPNTYKESVFNSWQLKNYDNGCVKYSYILSRTLNKQVVCNTFEYRKYFDIVVQKQGYKFPNFFLFNNMFNILDRYSYVAILDDDLLINNQYQEQPFDTIVSSMKKYNLDICSPMNDGQGKFSEHLNNIIEPIPNKRFIFITNFCEMGFMVISSKLLKIIIEEYKKQNLKILDYGFDWFICKIANENLFKIGLINHISFYNPKQPQRYYEIYRQKKDKIEHIKTKILDIIVPT